LSAIENLPNVTENFSKSIGHKVHYTSQSLRKLFFNAGEKMFKQQC
jgi:hypothetical protein